MSKQLQPSAGDDRSSVARTAVGTPGYMAPEVLQGLTGSTHSYPVDWWALGLLVTVLVTGYEPFTMGTEMALARKLPAAGESSPRSSGEVAAEGGGGSDGGLDGSGVASASRLVQERLDELFPHKPHFADVLAFTKALLAVDPTARLGTAGGAEEVQAHTFFDGIDWEMLVQCKLPPPLPGLGSRFDAPAGTTISCKPSTSNVRPSTARPRIFAYLRCKLNQVEPRARAAATTVHPLCGRHAIEV